MIHERLGNVTVTDCKTDGECRLAGVVASCCVCVSTVYRAVYDITVTPKFAKPSSAGARSVQKVQALVPGPPDAPEIWTRRPRHGHSEADGEDEAVIEWTEPRLSGVKVAGYQVYVNGKKTGSVLASSHRKAIIPLKAKRSVLILVDCSILHSQFNCVYQTCVCLHVINSLHRDCSLLLPSVALNEYVSEL